MNFGSVFVATCVASGIATMMMAFFANYPIAVAPAMGHNFYFAFAVVVAGVLFVLTAGVCLRERLITAIPGSLKHAIAAGIGLLISMVGLQWAGVIVDSPGTLVTLVDLRTTPVVVVVLGFTVISVLTAWNVRGALLAGFVISSIAAWAAGLTEFQGVSSMPPSLAPTLFQLNIIGTFHPDMIVVVFTFFFLALFDSVWTLVAVADQASLMQDGTLPRARGALLADAIGTVVGAGLGTSTVNGLRRKLSRRRSGWPDGSNSHCHSGVLLFSPSSSRQSLRWSVVPIR